VKKVIGAILAVAALFLSGCSQVDSAATVGETKIELSELQSQIDTILTERKAVDTSQMQLETGEALTRSQLAYMISNLIIDEVAKTEKIEISNSDLEAYKVEIYANIGGEANLPNILVNASIPSSGLEEGHLGASALRLERLDPISQRRGTGVQASPPTSDGLSGELFPPTERRSLARSAIPRGSLKAPPSDSALARAQRGRRWRSRCESSRSSPG